MAPANVKAFAPGGSNYFPRALALFEANSENRHGRSIFRIMEASSKPPGASIRRHSHIFFKRLELRHVSGLPNVSEVERSSIA